MNTTPTMSRRTLCRFHTAPGGCRKGAACTFSHGPIAPSNASPSPSIPDPSRTRETRTGNAPPGICNFYWTSGQCNREFTCRFRHTVNPGDAGAPRRASPVITTPLSADEAIAPFLTESGLAKLNGSGTDIFFANHSKPMTPNEAHNALKRFLYDDFRFLKTFDIYAFLIPLSNANSSNSTWNAEDGQLLLTSIATGNGLLRINDIIRWAPISPKAGSDRSVLSFQRGYLPLLRFYSSDFVVKSTLSLLSNGLYMRIVENCDTFCDQLEACMTAIMVAKSFEDPLAVANRGSHDGSQVIASLSGVLYECLTRFKNVAATHPRFLDIVRSLQEWTNIWISGITSSPPTFRDPLKDANDSVRTQIVAHLKSKVDRLVHIVDRELAKIDRVQKRTSNSLSVRLGGNMDDGIISALRITYDGPGELSREGKRHDNDFIDIQDIRIAPTREELLSRAIPFLPANIYDAPHPLPQDSMERILDIQFRLLREELTAPLKTSIQLVVDDMMTAKKKKTQLDDVLTKKGGKYRGIVDSQESIMFNVYTGVTFASLLPDRRGLSVSFSFDAPPGRARSPQAKARALFWEGMSGKRMMQGGLIALVWKHGFHIDVQLGVLASSVKDLTESAKANADRVSARIVFFDPALELRILRSLKDRSLQDGSKFLVEAPVMFEAIRPFLEALKMVPESVPFGQYLVHRPRNFFPSFEVQPPLYARNRHFAYQLAPLFPTEAGVGDLRLFVNDPQSIANARRELRRSRLDPSQADAVVDALTREIALIQGPPGTGKSFTGVELLRVLVQSAKPILMIAFTNHALDHILTSVLDARITDKIVRLGSRSADERIQQYSIEALETVAGRSRLHHTFSRNHRDLKDIEEQIMNLMKNFTRTIVSSEQILEYIEIQFPEHSEHILTPPRWIYTIHSLSVGDQSSGGWKRAGKKTKGRQETEDNSMYAFWVAGGDLDFLSTKKEAPAAPKPSSKSAKAVSGGSKSNKFAALQETKPNTTGEVDDTGDEDDEDLQPWERSWTQTSPQRIVRSPEPVVSPPRRPITPPTPPAPTASANISIADLQNPADFFVAYGYDQVPQVPLSDCPLDELLSSGMMWTLSITERKRLDAFWTQRIQETSHENNLEAFSHLREKYSKALQIFNEGKDETRRQLLQSVDIVGCTTTGAAKLTSLLKSLSPRIMLVEEAGQVLEAHVLGSLVPTVEHMILIGDPLQLRPTLNNYSLSVDSKRGSQLYRFDMSLMERLSSADFPMSQIDVQRRMRPAISNLIRKTLYPRLVDHNLVKEYPNVRGFAKNVYFLSHTHKENGGSEESSSKYNMFEVEMIRDLVLFLLRQGCYSQEGDIVVLCAYLGQLARVRDALADTVTVVIDERDQADLADHEDESVGVNEPLVEQVKVSKRVRLRTVDNYQGEEARIVILSLVRNAGNQEERGSRPTIGFLKSDNRTNVSLSRAKEGLFILGNAPQLASKSRMWRGVIEELEEENCLGGGFPIACYRHPDAVTYISEPGKLSQFAPDGGCLRSCDARLKCGHVCPYKCHPDDPSHVAVICSQRCTKLCARRHPCDKECAEACGLCKFEVSDVELPCGHTSLSVACYLLDNIAEAFCNVIVTKRLPTCEHLAEMRCSDDPALYICTQVCGGVLACCGRDCKSNCHTCQEQNGLHELEEARRIKRTSHIQHPCHKPLRCAHECLESCSQDHKCVVLCKEQCRQECSHARCQEYCSTPCAPCQEPCTWGCPHYRCPLPCGSVCARLPCDRRCEKILGCGHRCPSACGEDCNIQICPRCAPPEIREKIVDLILYRNLEDIAEDDETLDEMLITLPKCRHVFTIETLDGLCGMEDYYDRASDGRWVDLKTPVSQTASGERKKPPVCPTCRSAITSPRYGRVYKSADLDILERNVISRMTLQLDGIQTSMDTISKSKMKTFLSTQAPTIKAENPLGYKTARKAQRDARTALLQQKQEAPVPARAIMPGNTQLFSIAPTVLGVWNKAVKPLMQVYERTMKVAEMRSAHTSAWEAAWSCLYRREMELAVLNPAQAPRRPKEFALRMARMKVGQPQPRADKRFLVEAFWVSLKIRFSLADLARIWLKSVGKESQCYTPQQCQMWASYGVFLLDTCQRDACAALDIATESESRRQMTSTSLLIMRVNLERFRFDVVLAEESGIMRLAEERQTLVDRAFRGANDANIAIQQTVGDHVAILPNDGQEWITVNFLDTAMTILEEWNKLRISISRETFYEAVSLDEKMSIVKAFSFSYGGHFYNCPNGHTYTITECGGAMQQAACPECGASIGGSSHNLNASNTRATEFEELSRQTGAQPSPFHWGR